MKKMKHKSDINDMILLINYEQILYNILYHFDENMSYFIILDSESSKGRGCFILSIFSHTMLFITVNKLKKFHTPRIWTRE